MWLTKCLFARTRKNIIIQSANTTTIYFCLPAKWETEIDIFSCSLVLDMIQNSNLKQRTIKIYQLVLHVFHFWILSFYDWIFFDKLTRFNFISWYPVWAGRDSTKLWVCTSIMTLVEHKRKRYCWEWIGCDNCTACS